MVKGFEELNKIGRKPIIAQIGGFRPVENIKSSFGGSFYFPSDYEWPKNDNGAMIPILQIAIDELPVDVEELNKYKIIQIFLDSQELPVDTPVENGKNWLIKTYKNIDSFIKVETPNNLKNYKEFQVKWSIGENDYPCWEEAWDYVDLTEINNDENLSDEFFDKYDQYNFTKIGGYASYIQSPGLDNYNFIIQISSEEKPGFMIGDNGNLYIGISNDNEWFMHWDCY